MCGLVWLEDHLLLVGWDPVSAIGNNGVDPGPVDLDVDADLIPAVALGVGEEVAKDLSDPLRISEGGGADSVYRSRCGRRSDRVLDLLDYVNGLVSDGHVADIAVSSSVSSTIMVWRAPSSSSLNPEG